MTPRKPGSTDRSTASVLSAGDALVAPPSRYDTFYLGQVRWFLPPAKTFV